MDKIFYVQDLITGDSPQNNQEPQYVLLKNALTHQDAGAVTTAQIIQPQNQQLRVVRPSQGSFTLTEEPNVQFRTFTTHPKPVQSEASKAPPAKKGKGRSKTASSSTAPKKPAAAPRTVTKPRNVKLRPLNQVPRRFAQSLRLVDLDVLAHCLWCDFCKVPLSLRDCIMDEVNAFKSILQVQCSYCLSTFPVPLSRMSSNGGCEAYRPTVSSMFDFKSFASRCFEAGQMLDRLYRLQEEKQAEMNLQEAGMHPTEELIMMGNNVNQGQMVNIRYSNSGLSVEPMVAGDELGATLGPADTITFLDGDSKEIVREQIVQRMSAESQHSIFSFMSLPSQSDPEKEIIVKVEKEDSSEPMLEDDEETGLEPEVESPDDSADEDWGPVKSAESSSSAEEEGEPEDLDPTSTKQTQRHDMEKCLYCSEEFADYKRAIKHMKKNHPDYLLFKCGVCGKQCVSGSSFRTHINGYHRKQYKRLCPHCGIICRNGTTLTTHLLTHVPDTEATIPCPYCPKLSKSKVHLQRHMQSHMPAYTCDVCTKKIRKRNRLIEHLKMHLENKMHECEVCGARFERKDNMLTHMKNNHNWICLVCFGKFKTPEAVQAHVDEDHSLEDVADLVGEGAPYQKVTRFQCKTCLRYLASKQSLEFHEATHSGDAKKRIRKPSKRS